MKQFGRVLSGIQPTGVPHIGNYLGALRQWKALQEGHASETIFSIADLHSLTVDYNPQELQNKCRTTAASLLAIGIDPTKAIFFRQSTVSGSLVNVVPVETTYSISFFLSSRFQRIPSSCGCFHVLHHWEN